MTKRENSFSDSEGRSLTPDLSEDEDQGMIGPSSPVASPIEENRPPAHEGLPQQHFVYPPSDVQHPVQSADAPVPAMTESTPNVLFQDSPPSITIGATSAPGAVPTRSATMASTGQSATFSSGLSPPTPGAAADRFRASVRRVIHMNRASSAMSLGGAGAEPGIDPRRSSAFLNYGHIRQRCNIELIDYSSVRESFGRMQNKTFVELMMDRRASKREPWVKVRWINIGGVSWDVISALALRYDIHPLALEDVLHQRGNQSRSKADYYMQHLFIRILRHTLAEDDVDDPNAQTVLAPSITRKPRSSSPEPMSEEEEDAKRGSWGKGEAEDDLTLAGSRFSTKRAHESMVQTPMRDLEKGKRGSEKHRTQASLALRMRRRRVAEEMTIDELKKGERVNVNLTPFFLFLFRDGTVISISQSTDLNFTAPILARLRQRDTGLRLTADPSLLVQSLLDLIVDQAMEVVDKYQSKILKLEHHILVKPSMKSVRHLHIISNDLTLHKRTLDPIKTLIYGLRRYDVDRCAALVNSAGQESGSVKIEGFMSHKSKIYLADVHDHIDFIINSLDMFSGTAENLINYTFNMASYEMNEVMRRLTLATIIFLPLTLLTGYFGMNFEPFSAVNNHSDLLFWEIALPVMAVVVPLFVWPDIIRMWHYFQKRMTTHKVKQSIVTPAKKTQ